MRHLLAPVDPARFLNEYWGRVPLFIKGRPDKFRGFFDRRRFFTDIRRAGRTGGSSACHLAEFRPTDPSSLFTLTTMSQHPIRARDVARALARGATICVTRLDDLDPRLSAFRESIRREIGYLGDIRVNAYYSTDGFGADTHFDARVSTTLQIHGRKRWRFSAAPALIWPMSNAQVGVSGEPVWAVPGIGAQAWARVEAPNETDFTEVVLEPGDVLCLPAGVWHQAKAIGSSLALNLSFGPAHFTTYLATLLDSRFAGHAGWRGGFPPVFTPDLPPGKAPEPVRRYLEERLRELQAWLRARDPADTAIADAWEELVRSL